MKATGAIWPNVGCVLTGVSLFTFFLGSASWYVPEKWKTARVVAAQLVGFVDGFAFIMFGVFSEDFQVQHIFWSDYFFKTNLVVLIITGIALLFHPKFYKCIALYGFAVAVINLMFVFFAMGSPLLEWMTEFLALGFVALFAFN